MTPFEYFLELQINCLNVGLVIYFTGWSIGAGIQFIARFL